MSGRVFICGALAQQPVGAGGLAWAFLQYVLGFRRLGFDVYYLEHLAAESCIDENWQRTDFAASANAGFFTRVMRRFGLAERSALLEWDGERHVGLSRRELECLAPEVDLLVNLSGRFHLQSVLRAVRRRLYVDLDPGFTQIWQAQYGKDMNFDGHDVHVTVGLDIGQPVCPFPTCGIRWQTTLPPVVLAEWATDEPAGAAYTTVGDWRGYSPVEWKGIWYGQKSEEFMRIIALPERAPAPLELCLAIHPEEPDRARLLANGWRLSDPRVHAADVDQYRDYVWRSRGELSAVKQGYAAGASGWFSDRSACYLAAGRPVVVQETGVSRHLPTGAGLLTFDGVDAAAAALAEVEHEYARHAAAARAIAREFLDSDRVLTRLWELARS
jgi:hypothetical protein